MRKRFCANPLPLRGGDNCSIGESQQFEVCGEYLCPVWTEDTRLAYDAAVTTPYFHQTAPDYLYTNECDVHIGDPNGKYPGNYIISNFNNNPQLHVTMDFGFSVVIKGVYLKNSQNSISKNQ